MKAYAVRIKATISKVVVVEAESDQAAIEAAHEDFSVLNDDNPEKYNQEVESCEEVPAVSEDTIARAKGGAL